MCSLDKVVDVVSNHYELLLLLGNLLLLDSHQFCDVLGEEAWLDGVNDVEQELLVENLLIAQVRQISSDDWILESKLDQSLGCQLWHSGHSHYLDVIVEESLYSQMMGACCKSLLKRMLTEWLAG